MLQAYARFSTSILYTCVVSSISRRRTAKSVALLNFWFTRRCFARRLRSTLFRGLFLSALLYRVTLVRPTWVGLTDIRMFHHLAHLPSQFCPTPVCPSRIWQTLEHQNTSQLNPCMRPPESPCNGSVCDMRSLDDGDGEIEKGGGNN